MREGFIQGDHCRGATAGGPLQGDHCRRAIKLIDKEYEESEDRIREVNLLKGILPYSLHHEPDCVPPTQAL